MLASIPAVAVWLAMLAGCSTDPVNPDGCRQIEYARCEAALSCPTEFPKLDLDSCKRFYRDQCLHGLASEEDPGQPRIDQCVKAIGTAALCANAKQEPCELEVTKTAVACDVIQHPEIYKECEFLAPPPPAQLEAGVDAAAEAEAAAD